MFLQMQQAAQESRDEVIKVLQGADMVFVTVSAGAATAGAAAAAAARTAKARHE
jgi:cell division protein FtsZ